MPRFWSSFKKIVEFVTVLGQWRKSSFGNPSFFLMYKYLESLFCQSRVEKKIARAYLVIFYLQSR